jgi:hypothetical protein
MDRATVAREQPQAAAGVLPRLRELLADARRRGEPFEAAWDAAVPRAVRPTASHERATWTTILTATREAWGRAYNGEPAAPHDLAAARIAGLLAD